MRNVLIVMMMIFSSATHAQWDMNLNHFRLAAMGLYQNQQSSYSMIGSWNPKLYKKGPSVFGLNIGGSVFEDQMKKKFLMVETLVTYRYLFSNRWKAEAGLGFQSMSQDIGTHGVASVSLHYGFLKNRMNIDDVFVGYSNFSYGKEEIHQVRIGLGFHF